MIIVMNGSKQQSKESDPNVKRVVLFIATAGSFLNPFMLSSLNIALPSIQKDFSADAVILSWIATTFLLSSAIFLVPVGKIADIYGRSKIYKWGIILFTVVSFASGLAPTIELLILMRFLQGVGGAMIMTTGMALITSVFPPQERGRALGFNVSAVYIGLSLGPFIGGLLTQSLGWRSIFLIISPLGLIIIYLASKYLKTEWADAKDEKLDIPGSLIYALALVFLVYGFSLLPRFSGIVLILCGIPGFILFIKRQMTIPNPVFEVRLFQHNKVFAFSSVAALINYSGTTAVTFLLSLYLQYIKAMTPQQAGTLLIIQPIIMALLSPYAGRLSDRKEPAVISSLGMASTAFGLFLLTFLKQDTPLALIVCALIVLGVGFALFSSPNTNAIMSTVEKRFYGIASASVSTMRLLGQMFSMAIATLVISLFVGKNQINPEYFPMFIKSIHISFIIFTVLCTIGIFFSYSRGSVHKNNK